MCRTNKIVGQETKNVSDKMIGCLCRFWDKADEDNKRLRVLVELSDNQFFPYKDDNGNHWECCEPVDPNEVKFCDSYGKPITEYVLYDEAYKKLETQFNVLYSALSRYMDYDNWKQVDEGGAFIDDDPAECARNAINKVKALNHIDDTNKIDELITIFRNICISSWTGKRCNLPTYDKDHAELKWTEIQLFFVKALEEWSKRK